MHHIKILFFILNFTISALFAQTGIQLTRTSKKLFYCKLDNSETSYIKGYDDKNIVVLGRCYNKRNNDVTFERSNFNMVEDISPSAGIFHEYEDFVYTTKGPKVPSLFKFQAKGGDLGQYATLYYRMEPVKDHPTDSFCVEYACHYISSFSYSIQNGYSTPNNYKLFEGIALSRYDSTGHIIWSHIFPRGGIRTWGGYPDDFGQPLLVQRNNMIYFFYVDQATNYDTPSYIHIPRSWPNLEKWDLICIKINPETGTFEKTLVHRQGRTNCQLMLYQTIDFGDGNYAIMGTADNLYSYTFYHLKIEE